VCARDGRGHSPARDCPLPGLLPNGRHTVPMNPVGDRGVTLIREHPVTVGVARKGNAAALRHHGVHLVVNDLGELLA
jgi:hypothetical protein